MRSIRIKLKMTVKVEDWSLTNAETMAVDISTVFVRIRWLRDYKLTRSSCGWSNEHPTQAQSSCVVGLYRDQIGQVVTSNVLRLLRESNLRPAVISIRHSLFSILSYI